MPEFALWAMPKMLEKIEEARRRSHESNHTLGVENGGSRSSTHLLHFAPLELAEFWPQA